MSLAYLFNSFFLSLSYIQYHECVKHAPRFRCTQLIHKLLEAMGSEACLPVELFDIIQRVLLRRSTDVKVVIFPIALLTHLTFHDLTHFGYYGF